MSAAAVAQVARRLEALELQTLRSLCEKQHAEIDRLREHVDRAEEVAEFWREEALELQEQLCEVTNGRLGLTQGGHLVVTA